MPKLISMTRPSGARMNSHISGPWKIVWPNGVSWSPALVWVTAAEKVNQATSPVSATPPVM